MKINGGWVCPIFPPLIYCLNEPNQKVSPPLICQKLLTLLIFPLSGSNNSTEPREGFKILKIILEYSFLKMA